MSKLIATIIVTITTLIAQAADGPYVPTDAERARWTLQDMRSWKIALEAYNIDHKSYPAARSLKEAAAAVEGKYISAVPMHDAWGNPYVYERTESGYRIVSSGADGRFDRSGWTVAGQLESLEADAVITNDGKFWLRSWKFR
jgi:hypothetical protein